MSCLDKVVANFSADLHQRVADSFESSTIRHAAGHRRADGSGTPTSILIAGRFAVRFGRPRNCCAPS